MKNILIAALLFVAFTGLKAQYAAIDARLAELEARRGSRQKLKEENFDSRKFVLIKDFDDHTERQHLIIHGDKATFVEVFDDKSTGQISSNVFTGDVVRTDSQILSFRFDMLEGQKIPLPITKTLMMNKQKKILYLQDINTKERWVDEAAINKK